MSIYLKLLQARQAIGTVSKDKTMQGGKQSYRYTSIAEVSDAVREALNDVGLAFFPAIEDVQIVNGRYLIKYLYTFVDVEAGETLSMAWAGEALAEYINRNNETVTDDKALGKAHTYAEKYFFLRLFIVTSSDDPDIDDTESPSRPQTRQNANGGGNMTKSPAEVKTHPPHEMQILKLGQEVYGDEWLHGNPSVLLKTLRFLFGSEVTEERVQHLSMEESKRLIAALEKKRDDKKAQEPEPEGDIPF